MRTKNTVLRLWFQAANLMESREYLTTHVGPPYVSGIFGDTGTRPYTTSNDMKPPLSLIKPREKVRKHHLAVGDMVQVFVDPKAERVSYFVNGSYKVRRDLRF